MSASRSGRVLQRVLAAGVVAVASAFWLGAGCQHQRIETPQDRLSYLGPFAVHLAYTDGERILGRSAPTVPELADAPTVVLLDPEGLVEGLSMTFFRHRRWVAWRDGQGLLHASPAPGTPSGSVVVAATPHATRPGIVAASDRLYVTSSIGPSVIVFWSADGQTWDWNTVARLPFTVGSTDIVHADGRLWIAATSKDRAGTDTAVLLRVSLNSLGQPLRPVYLPIAELPAIDGGRRIRVASDGTSLAVACVSQPVDFRFTGVEDNRTGYVAVSDPIAGPRLSWSLGAGEDGGGDLSCPPALVFVREAGPSGPVSRLGRVYPSGGQGQQSLVAVQGGQEHYAGQRTAFEEFTRVQVYDAALAYGQERVSLQDTLREGLVPPIN